VWVNIQRGDPIRDPLIVNGTNAQHVSLRGIMQPDFLYGPRPSAEYGPRNEAANYRVGLRREQTIFSQIREI
jgi:hypothetical protein